jgi:ADP-ribose pyrophosphatase YjhB (NUDIX family)/uncharacterized protein YndB with AHSA1/START domain
MFTVGSLLESWLTALADVEPVVGGKYELFWEPEDRENNSTLGCTVTAIERDQFLSFEWKSPKQFKHFANDADPLTHVSVAFVPRGAWTHVHLLHSGWRSGPEWEEARQWQGQAWSVAFERLDRLIQGESARAPAGVERGRRSLGAFALLFDPCGRILLCHRQDMDVWNLPGGGVERGELPTEAAIRETREETGLDVTVERLVGVYGKADKADLVFAFECGAIGGRLTTTDEADECRYFDVASIPRNTLPKHVERIRDALDARGLPVFRVQRGPSTRDFVRSLRGQDSRDR